MFDRRSIIIKVQRPNLLHKKRVKLRKFLNARYDSHVARDEIQPPCGITGRVYNVNEVYVFSMNFHSRSSLFSL